MIERRGAGRLDRARRLGAAVTGGGPVTNGLIALCCVVFLISPLSGFGPRHGSTEALLAAQAGYFERWGVIPSELLDGPARAALTPLTALFVHGSWLHLLGNMLFLYVFGAMAEERMGHAEFVFFYLCCGYLALVVYAVTHSGSDQFHHSFVHEHGYTIVMGEDQKPQFFDPRGRLVQVVPPRPRSAGPGSPVCSRSSSSCRCVSRPGSC